MQNSSEPITHGALR